MMHLRRSVYHLWSYFSRPE